MKDRWVSACVSAVIKWRATCAAVAFAAVVGIAPASQAADAGNWVGSWTASPQPAWGADFPVPLSLPANLWKQTIRQNARLSIGGSKVRIVLSNAYGAAPLTIGAAHIALAGEDGKIQEGSDHTVTFGGESSIVIPPGAPAISDPVDISVAPLALVSVSLYLPDITPTSTIHWDGHETAYIAAGNKAADVDFKADSKLTQRMFLSEILVDAPANARAVVAFGDSITDGDGSTVDGNDRWPDRLAERFVAAGAPVAVLNEGISGAKVLSDRMGVNNRQRLRDRAGQPLAHGGEPGVRGGRDVGAGAAPPRQQGADDPDAAPRQRDRPELAHLHRPALGGGRDRPRHPHLRRGHPGLPQPACRGALRRTHHPCRRRSRPQQRLQHPERAGSAASRRLHPGGAHPSGLDSAGERNKLGEPLRWCHPPEGLSRAFVEFLSHGVQLPLGEGR